MTMADEKALSVSNVPQQVSMFQPLMILLAALCYIASLISTILVLYFLSSAESYSGRVTQVIRKQRQGSDGGISYHPEITFSDQSGKTITFVSSLGSSPPRYRVNDSVKVLYNSQYSMNPARIDSPWSLWFVPLITLFFGIEITIVLVVLRYFGVFSKG